MYQSLRRFSPIRNNATQEEKPTRGQSVDREDQLVQPIEYEEEGMSSRDDSMLSYLKSTEMAVSKPRGRPPKKAPAKAKPKRKLGLAATKKRSPPATSKTERASKIQKTVPKANSGKRVNGRGASVTDAFVIFDSDEEDFDQQQSRTDSLTPPRQMLKIDSQGNEDDLKPILTPTSMPTHSNNLENKLVRMKVAHAREIECLRLQLSASEAKVKQIEEDAEREALELQHRQSISSDKQMADLEDELQVERRRTSDLAWECDHLRREMESARSCLKGEADLIQQRDEYERLYKEEQDTNADLVRGLVENDEDSTRKAIERAEEIQQLTKQIEDLQREVSDLRNENAALRTSANSIPQIINRASSPSPSLSSSQSTSASDAELRLVNIRKTYITVKKRYDNLHSVASNISTATRSWDYGSFGEFGQYLRQLKTALDENGPEEQGAAVTGSRVVKVD